jgi:hypothetical protein
MMLGVFRRASKPRPRRLDWRANTTAIRTGRRSSDTHRGNDHHDARYVLFVARKAKKSDQKGPTTARPAKHYSVDQKKWLPIPIISCYGQNNESHDGLLV